MLKTRRGLRRHAPVGVGAWVKGRPRGALDPDVGTTDQTVPNVLSKFFSETKRRKVEQGSDDGWSMSRRAGLSRAGGGTSSARTKSGGLWETHLTRTEASRDRCSTMKPGFNQGSLKQTLIIRRKTIARINETKWRVRHPCGDVESGPRRLSSRGR